MSSIFQVYSKDFVDNLLAENKQLKAMAEAAQMFLNTETGDGFRAKEQWELEDALAALDQPGFVACDHSRKKNGNLHAICKKCGHSTAPADRGNVDSKQSCPHFRTYETDSGKLACHDCDWTQ